MSQVILDETPAGAPEPEPTPPARTPRVAGTWHLTWHGIRTVAALELRQRVRSTRWIVALIVWFVVVGAITLLTTGFLGTLMGNGELDGRGPVLFAVVTFLVLGLGLVVTPTLTSTAINGDRNAGTLATLQVTLLSPAEIALGKLLAAWAAALSFLVASLPFLALALSLGEVPVLASLRVLLLVALLLGAICGIGLGWSALTARTAGSTVLTFVTVTALTIFTPILFGLTYPSIQAEEEVQVWGVPISYDWSGDEEPPCEWSTEVRTVAHTERTWWLLGLNPFVVVADGAGTTADGATTRGDSVDPLGAIRDGVRTLRAGAGAEIDECWYWGTEDAESPVQGPPVSDAPVWPWGLAANLALGAVGFVVAVRRLRVPTDKLARGTRVA